jgi:LDH2 family malate/lactate/ureidoglycolate dehydrogenase
MLLLVVDPTVSMPHETFAARMDDLVDRIHGSRRAAGADEIRLPGERAARTMTERRTDGIPLRPALLTRLRAIAAELGVPTSV